MDNEAELVDDQYLSVYEYDPDAGPSHSSTGEVVCQVPRQPQIDALASIAGEGAVEPDGWIEGYNTMLPVLDGVPIAVIEQSNSVGGSREGAESWTRYAVDDALGMVEIHRAGRHPTNVSKIKVNECKGD